jgi:hypothetical protein
MAKRGTSEKLSEDICVAPRRCFVQFEYVTAWSDGQQRDAQLDRANSSWDLRGSAMNWIHYDV